MRGVHFNWTKWPFLMEPWAHPGGFPAKGIQLVRTVKPLRFKRTNSTVRGLGSQGTTVPTGLSMSNLPIDTWFPSFKTKQTRLWTKKQNKDWWIIMFHHVSICMYLHNKCVFGVYHGIPKNCTMFKTNSFDILWSSARSSFILAWASPARPRQHCVWEALHWPFRLLLGAVDEETCAATGGEEWYV